MKKKIFIIIGSLSIFIVFFSGCMQQSSTKSSNQELGLEILNIREAVPYGWNYTVVTQNLEEIPRPHGLWKPVAIVNFTNPSNIFEVAGGDYRNLSLWLYFYHISEKQEIMGIIVNESIYSWCVPIYFNETNRYIIVTSPCYINSGVSTEETQRYYTVLEKSLKE
ncbi:MAG: hypothetical protein NTX92_07660, partial [Euryarchaeota archaeon]|nr:hypothetical protein [Euryarchaeota archaeon]